MTDTDRGSELVRDMLRRRAVTAPAALGDRIAGEVRQARQVARLRDLRRAGLALAVVLVVAAGVAAGYAVGGQQGRAGASAGSPGPTGSEDVGGAAIPSPSPPPEPSASATAGSTLASVPPSRPTAPPALTVGALAVVTPAGDRLRVRTEPGVGGASAKLEPLLRAGTRMLVVRGPVTADNHDWYEVSVDGDPSFGWVASSGAGETWIAPAAPRCSGGREPAEAWELPSIDLLACYGAAPFMVQAVGAPEAIDSACSGLAGAEGCTLEPAWLLSPSVMRVVAAGSPPAPLRVAVPPDLVARLEAAAPAQQSTLVIALDQPLAQGCRIVDDAGHDLVPRDEAITMCRLTFTVLAIGG